MINVVVSATRGIGASARRIFELIADPAKQPRWDGNDNEAGARQNQLLLTQSVSVGVPGVRLPGSSACVDPCWLGVQPR